MGNLKQLIKDLRETHDLTDVSDCVKYYALMKGASFLIEEMVSEIEGLRAEIKDLRREPNEAYNH